VTDYHTDQPTVFVLDFGAQYAQLIARRVREARVYSEIVPYSISAEEVERRKPAAIILSGGPASVYAEGAPHMDPAVLEMGIPILGFCYGIQEMALHLGGEIPKTDIGEYGFAELEVTDAESVLLAGVPATSQCWMSHRDSVGTAPAGFSVTARTATTARAPSSDFVSSFTDDSQPWIAGRSRATASPNVPAVGRSTWTGRRIGRAKVAFASWTKRASRSPTRCRSPNQIAIPSAGPRRTAHAATRSHRRAGREGAGAARTSRSSSCRFTGPMLPRRRPSDPEKGDIMGGWGGIGGAATV